MRMTIGKKLGFGFGIVIALMAGCAAVAFFQLSVMDERLTEAFDHAVPSTRACERALTGIARARGAMRGYLAVAVLSGDAGEMKDMLQNRNEAWELADGAMRDLEGLSAEWSDDKARKDVELIKSTIVEVRNIQSQIEEMLRRPDNVPANYTLATEVAPRGESMLESLAALIDEERAAEPTPDRKRLLQSLFDVQSSLALSCGSIRAFLGSGNPTFKQEFEKHWQKNEQAAQAVRGMAHLFNPQQRAQWDQFVQLQSELKPLAAKTVTLREDKNWNQAVSMWESESRPRARKLTELLEHLAATADKNLSAAKDEVRAAGDLVDLSLILATGAAIIIGCVVAFVLGRKIAVATRMLADRAQEISAGDLTGQSLLLKSTDELGDLAGGFNVMLGNLKDLTKQILTVTESVNSATTQIASSTRQQASSTKEQAATVQQITTTMKELSQSGAQIIDKAREVAAAAESVSESSKSGIEAVLGTNRTMEAIREQVEEVAENIVALSEKTQAVGEIIATVNDIAEQSNLLALNASIEAADAGDEGNRFSVVASEMKNLADQAKDCTVQVRSILGEIQKGINSAVMLTEEAVKRVDTGKQQADISERTIRDMVATTQTSVQAYQQIIGATNQQQVGYEQVSKGMQDIDLAARQTASSTAQLEQALGSLAAMSHQLRTAVTAYRV